MPEASLNASQILALDRIASIFLSKIDGKREGSELVTRREGLSNALNLSLKQLSIAGHSVGGLVERTLDHNFMSLVGNDLIFNLKRIAFPEGSETDFLTDSLDKRRSKDVKPEVGQVLISYSTGFEITSIKDGVIKGKLLVIESTKRKEYVSANVPEYKVSSVNDLDEISIPITEPFTTFDNINDLKDFLFDCDITRYRIYTEMCRYLVTSLRMKIQK